MANIQLTPAMTEQEERTAQNSNNSFLNSGTGSASSAKTGSALETLLNSKAPLASPVLTGTPTAPTPLQSVSDMTIVNATYVNSRATVKAYHNTTQSIPNNVDTAINLNSEYWDTDTMHDLVTNNGRITFKTAGFYIITYTGSYPNNVNNARELWLAGTINGNSSYSSPRVDASVSGRDAGLSLTLILKVNVNDFLQAKTWQACSSALDLTSAELSAIRVS
jgi:hypothetical protein